MSDERSSDRERLGNARRAIRLAVTGEATAADREWLRDRMEAMAGTRDLEEANRRMDVVWEWRDETRAGGRDGC